MNFYLYQEQEPIYIMKKLLSQCANIEAQTSDEIQPIKSYWKKSVVFDNMLRSKQASNFYL